MVSLLGSLGRAFDPAERRRLGGFFAIVAALHVAAATMLGTVATRSPAILVLGSTAYLLGLRHAFDADHITAIDNTTRKLLQEGRRPMGAGFFFSLGHSTVVFLIALALGVALRGVFAETGGGQLATQLKATGGLIGTGVSGFFLVVIGILNLVILVDIANTYRRMRRGDFDRKSLERELVGGGVMTRLFSRLFKLVSASWQMYPIGFLFGLGFDTATEVTLLAITATVTTNGLLAVLALPVTFAAGMSLMDTADGAFMAKAYTWAFSNPLRKVFYNLAVTGLSVFVALFVGLVELLQILSDRLHLEGGVWSLIDGIDFTWMGFIIVVAFFGTWLVAYGVWRSRRIEERWRRRLETG